MTTLTLASALEIVAKFARVDGATSVWSALTTEDGDETLFVLPFVDGGLADHGAETFVGKLYGSDAEAFRAAVVGL
jgi:hypothetical protein